MDNVLMCTKNEQWNNLYLYVNRRFPKSCASWLQPVHCKMEPCPLHMFFCPQNMEPCHLYMVLISSKDGNHALNTCSHLSKWISLNLLTTCKIHLHVHVRYLCYHGYHVSVWPYCSNYANGYGPILQVNRLDDDWSHCW